MIHLLPTRHALLFSALVAIGVAGFVQNDSAERYVPSTEQLVVEVFVRDLDASISFYRDLGFRFVRRDETFAELAWEDHLFFLDASPPPELDRPAANIRIMVPNVNEHWDRARAAGARVLRPIDDRYYGLRDFTIADPDGFGVRFATRLEHLE